MKIKIFTILFLSIFLVTSGKTQIKSKKNKTISKSLSSLSLNLQQQNINFNFVWFNDYLKGLGSYEGNYSSNGQIRSNINWQLSCKAKGKFTHTDGRKTIPLNNIGISVYCKNMKEKINKTLNSPMSLSNNNKTLLFTTKKNKPNKPPKGKSKGKGNAWGNGKDKEKNKTYTDDIIIYWEMGTRKGKMNKKSLNQQKLKRGAYSVDIEFIVSEKL